jgi:hypothetical protein
MENSENDQGQSAEESTSDPIVDGDGAAVEQKGTVEQEATPADAKGTETDEGNPYADLLKQYVPQKDYTHAQRKITEQGQELSARDAEVAQLRADVQKLTTQVSTKSLITDDDGYEVADEDAVINRGVTSELQQIKEALAAQTERLNAQEDVIISSATESQRIKGVETVKADLGLTDELAVAVQSLREQGKIDEAIALAGKAAVIADAQRTKAAEAPKAEPILSGNESAEIEEQEPQPLKPEDLPEDVDKRGGFHLARIKKAFGL